jgi:hypothetical protein
MTISCYIIIVKFEQNIIVFIRLARVLTRGWLCDCWCILSLFCLLLSFSSFLSLSLLLLAFSSENAFSVVQAEAVLPPGRMKGEEEVKD